MYIDLFKTIQQNTIYGESLDLEIINNNNFYYPIEDNSQILVFQDDVTKKWYGFPIEKRTDKTGFIGNKDIEITEDSIIFHKKVIFNESVEFKDNIVVKGKTSLKSNLDVDGNVVFKNNLNVVKSLKINYKNYLSHIHSTSHGMTSGVIN